VSILASLVIHVVLREVGLVC